VIATSSLDVHIAVIPDQAAPLKLPLGQLTPAERALAPPSGLGRHHFALGRAAAHEALGGLLSAHARSPSMDVVRGSNGEPRVRIDGRPVGVRVSIAHSGELAAACAWHDREDVAAGVDVERMTGASLETGDYLFSSREHGLLATTDVELSTAQLGAWTAKEAAWKALWPHQPRHPAAVELVELDMSAGCAVAAHPGDPARRPIRVAITAVPGLDSDYILALALLGDSIWVSNLTTILKTIPSHEIKYLALG
jgi:4'-phosphopantetheinyl transferase EntD